jgi:hypothetical protein
METKPDTRIRPQEAPRDPRFNPVGQVKTVNASISSTRTMGGLCLILAALSEDGTKIMDCPVYGLLKRKFAAAVSEPKQWYHSAINWKLGMVRDTFLSSECRLQNMLCIKKDGTCDEKALETCMKTVIKTAKSDKGSVHVSSSLIEFLPQLQSQLDAVKLAGITLYIYTGDSKAEAE